MKLELTINKNTVLDFLIALFICAGSLREVLANITSHPASLVALILYSLLLLIFFMADLPVMHIIKMIVPVIIVFSLVLGTWILYPERHSFYSASLYNIWDVMFPTMGVYLLAVSLLEENIENYVRIFKIVAYLMFVLCLVQSLDVIRNGVWTRGSIYNGQIVTIQANYNLNWGYNMLLPCIIFLGLYSLNKKKYYLVFTAIGFIEIFLYGSRGPLLIFVIYAALLYIYYSAKRNNRRGVVISLFVITAILLIYFGILQNVIVNIAGLLNIQSRTIDKLLDGTITGDSNRSFVYMTVISKIIEKPVLGWGIYGDRYFMNTMVQGGSAYSHNVFLEMMISFGIFGLLFMVILLVLIVRNLVRIKDERVRLVLLICIGDCLPLMLSLTFWNQSMFWVLIAVLVNLLNKKRLSKYM